METRLHFEIAAQPDDNTCGPTCLHAIYRFFDDPLTLGELVEQIPQVEEGGTLAVMLGSHALRRGYRAKIYSYNLQLLDPTWFAGLHRSRPMAELVEKLRAQEQTKSNDKLHLASQAMIEFLELGGELRMRDLDLALLHRYLKRRIPILTGLSATYLYGEPREIGATGQSDDVRGVATGHFVVVCGFDSVNRHVLVADPYKLNPLSQDHYYTVTFDRLICAILLGVLSYDGNLLIIEPRRDLNPQAVLAESGR